MKQVDMYVTGASPTIRSNSFKKKISYLREKVWGAGRERGSKSILGIYPAECGAQRSAMWLDLLTLRS